MASAGRQKTKPKRPPARRPASRSLAGKKAARPTPKRSKPAPKRPAAHAGKASSSAPPRTSAKSKEPEPELQVPLPDGRRHVLSLSFVRDGDEFLARLETDTGHITEFKNRSLDQLLTLVAGELEDLIE